MGHGMRYWFTEIFRELAKEDVKYVIAGGIAVNLLGVPRFTADLDLIVALEQKNVKKFAKCMTRLGFKPKVPVTAAMFADPKNREAWIKERNMIVFSFWRPDRPHEVVDVFVKEPIPFKKLWSKREQVSIENIKIPVISIDHLVQLKKQAGRLQDISDIEALKKLSKELKNETKSRKKRR
jgi:predicted nucleotidyltransferase